MMRHKRKIIIIILMMIVIIGGLYVFLLSTRISLPFPDEVHWVHRFASVTAISEPDSWGWPRYHRILSDGDELEYGESIELRVYYDSFGTQYGHAIGRTIYRDGERIRLVYISRTETLLSLMRRRLSPNMRTHYRITRTDALQDIGHGQQTIEIYYLQSLYRQRRRIESLSDADFDALRAYSSFVWRGTIWIPE